jgi:hypothetical protein
VIVRSPAKVMRHNIRCLWRCKHCGNEIGREIVQHYGIDLPETMIKPTWFFASMALLDHLRDCQSTDFSDTLRPEFGADFLNHPEIWRWFNVHATIERRVVGTEDLDIN